MPRGTLLVPGSVTELTDDGVGDAQLGALDATTAGNQLLLLGTRGGRNGENGTGSIDQGDARAQGNGRGTCHGGQAGTGFNRLGERLEIPARHGWAGAPLGGSFGRGLGRHPTNGRAVQR